MNLLVSILLTVTSTFYPQSATWLEKAESMKPQLHHTTCVPVRMVTPEQDSNAFQGWKFVEADITPQQIYQRPLEQGQVFTFDFGRHMVGYLTINTKTLRRCQDAPIRLKLFMGELPAELNTPLEPWKAWLSRAWMQEETINILQTDQAITIPRRMAGRYLKVEVIGTSMDFDCALSQVSFDAVSSAEEDLCAATTAHPLMDSIRTVSVETLRECMQTVYEDGPKRDQRLWAGDLYLQAMANRYSFRNFELTKRCLYLFAALADEKGVIISNIFEKPTPHPQIGSYMLTYALIWNSTLLEYLIDTEDYETANELWPVAKRQIEDALTYVGEDYIFDINKRDVWIFFDWRDGLDVATPMQMATIFALKQTYQLATMIGKQAEVAQYPKIAAQMTKAATKHMYDTKQGVFVSGPDKQVSVLSQTWAIKAEVIKGKKAQKALTTVLANQQTVMPGTPYATHYLIEALIMAGMNEQAKNYLLEYWGGMVRKGADTFWEAYDPTNDFISPYDFTPVNSACHAWSCTPVYFIGKYPQIFK